MSQADDVTYTDTDLVALLRAGDEEAISRLVERWSPTMFRLARSFVDSPQSAEDVVQEAWLGMLSGLARFEGRSSLRTWTFTILVNRARTRGAREARTLPRSPLEDTAVEPARTWFSTVTPSQWDDTPESAVLSREVLLQLDRAVSTLPSRQRQVVTMRDITGMSAEEVCAALGITPANQRVLLHRARAALRTALTGYYRG
ncbi:MAG TPA: sigma-70 family RNA polymerase sigma factor [Streptosporangiaceae bacterium]|jgi:RNA polymerase sigma-70 factor (ECF subfamily)